MTESLERYYATPRLSVMMYGFRNPREPYNVYKDSAEMIGLKEVEIVKLPTRMRDLPRVNDTLFAKRLDAEFKLEDMGISEWRDRRWHRDFGK